MYRIFMCMTHLFNTIFWMMSVIEVTFKRCNQFHKRLPKLFKKLRIRKINKSLQSVDLNTCAMVVQVTQILSMREQPRT